MKVPILEWLNKNEAVNTASKVPYRILKANKELSYGENNENMIIKGDNLEALKALLPYYKGQVKCIYIDPPFNTGSAFEHYDDNLEHSVWLSLMYSRLELLRELLAEDGIILIHIDHNEEPYLRIIMDEIYGRANYRNTILVSRIKKNVRERERIKALNFGQDPILLYTKSSSTTFLPPLKYAPKANRWHNFEAAGIRKGMDYDLFGFKPNPNNHWRWTQERANNAIKEGKLRPNPKTGKPEYLIMASEFEIMDTNWTDLQASAFNWKFPNGEKNEKLIQRIIDLNTNEGDLVLDSFLGSGTTCAVAQKMGRKYIGIEMGEHAITHCVPRMKAVIDGEQGGISKTLNWQGGGGYTFYDLGETVFDENGNINKNVDFKTLASHIWFSETKTPLLDFEKSPLLGVYNGTAYYLLYNGILGDKKPDGGNVLTQKIFDTLPKFNGKKVIYGEASRMNEDKRILNNITFKQTPYDVKAR